MNDFFENIIYKIGSSGPLMLFFSSLYLLRKRKTLFMYYLYGCFLNLILNLILKGLIKQKRPFEDPELFKIAVKHGNRFKFINGIPHDIFGMPSGHAQTIFFSTFFIFLALRNNYITSFYLFISLLTVYQRVLFNVHTVLQVVVGIIVGVLFSFLIYYMAQNQIMGKLRFKPDDNAFNF